MIKLITDLDVDDGDKATLISTLANWTAATKGTLPYARWVIVIGDDDAKDNGLSGYDAAGISELVLCEIFVRVIASGTIFITTIFPPEESVVSILRLLLPMERETIGPTPMIIFDDEETRLHAVMTWCLACSWHFVFLSTNEDIFLIGDDYRLEIGLKNGAEFSPVVEQTLKAVGFSLKDRE